jgi:hypothetical protein
MTLSAPELSTFSSSISEMELQDLKDFVCFALQAWVLENVVSIEEI